MAYNNWKLMDKIDVAVRTGPTSSFTGYIVEHGDKDAIEKAKDWARSREWDQEKREYTATYEPDVHTFANNGFTAKILNSAGGSSQGGRLSFWACEVEKDGVKFTIGVNDAILADLIKNSDISNGVVKQKVMFARKGGQPGLIHEGMDAYADATADMKHKANMKKAKKTSKWETGGVYSSITQTDVCIGDVWDTMEEYKETTTGWYGRTFTKLRKTDSPKKVTAWIRLSSSNYENGVLESFENILYARLGRTYIYFNAGRPPARAKTAQLEVKESDMQLIDKLLKRRERDEEKGQRYVREIFQ